MEMKRTFLTKRMALAALAATLGLGVMAGPTLAYYTDTTQANGSIPFSLTPETPPPPEEPEDPDTPPPPEEPEEPETPPPGTEVREEIEGTNKVIRVENVGETPAVVRVRAFYSTANATVTFAGEGWGTRADGEEGWLYGRVVLQPREVSEPLYINVEPLKSSQADSFDIAIVQQCVAPEGAAEGEPAVDAAVFEDGRVVLGELKALPAQKDAEAEGDSEPEASVDEDAAEGESAAARAAVAAASAVEGLVPTAERAADLIDATINPGVRA